MFNIDAQYKAIIDRCLEGGLSHNARTGHAVYIAEAPQVLTFDLRERCYPLLNNRRHFPHIAAAELAWQLMGTRDPAFIVEQAPKLWSKFVRNGELETAYGWRWRHRFGRDQLALAIDTLKREPSNRQLYISSWDPHSDGLGQPGQPPNIPCPVGFSVTQVRGLLNMSVFIRSSDVFVGLPYDLLNYAMLLDAIANSTGFEPAHLQILLANAHIYHVHSDMARTNHAPEHFVSRMPLVSWTIEDIEAEPHGYVATVKDKGKLAWQPQYNPRPDVVV